MKKLAVYLMIILGLAGCATVKEVTVDDPKTVEMKQPKAVAPDIVQVEPKEIEEEPLKELVEQAEVVEPEIIKGVIFGKTHFQGVLEDRDVRLKFQSIESPSLSFQFQISESSEEQILPWDVKRLDPGYFFVELPVGEYLISEVSILVGTTLASESIDIKFSVEPEAAVYLGTLSINGTKERIKLGGVPLIQPGFDYEVQVLDEKQEADRILLQRFPNLESEIMKSLLQVTPPESP